VLVDVLATRREPCAGEVIDIETLRLMRAGRNAVFDWLTWGSASIQRLL
jgi:hypothetical protein